MQLECFEVRGSLEKFLTTRSEDKQIEPQGLKGGNVQTTPKIK